MCKRKIAAAIAGICLVIVSGCQKKGQLAGPPLLNGQWASSDGVYTATFNNGVFTSTANDTGAVLASGNYVAQSETQVTINWTGNVSQQQNTAKCARTPKQMNCTDKNGRSFTLNRQSAVQG